MPAPFSALTLDAAVKLTAGWSDAIAAVSRRFYRGDHWQEGSGWIGPLPPANAPEYPEVYNRVQRQFLPLNLLAIMVGRHVKALAGNEPSWKVTPRRRVTQERPITSDEAAVIDETESALTVHGDRRRLLAIWQRGVADLLVSGRAPFRLLIPDGWRDEQGRLPKFGTLDAALDALYLDLEHPDYAGVVTDPGTRRAVGIVLFRREERQHAEISYLEDDGSTTLRTLGPEGDVGEAGHFDLGGHLFVHEMRAPALLTEPLHRLQRAVNFNLTQLMRNNELAGSPERTVLGGEPPGQWLADPVDPKTERFVAAPYRVGGGSVTFIQGTPLRDGHNRITGYTTPQIVFKDASSVVTFRETNDLLMLLALTEAEQIYTLMSSDATASGESRKQARAQFETSLKRTKAELDAVGRWGGEARLAFGACLMERAGAYKEYRLEFDAIIDAGPLTADEQRAKVEQYKDGLKSREKTMIELGNEDVDAEIARMSEEEQRRGNAREAGLAANARGFNAGQG